MLGFVRFFWCSNFSQFIELCTAHFCPLLVLYLSFNVRIKDKQQRTRENETNRKSEEMAQKRTIFNGKTSQWTSFAELITRRSCGSNPISATKTKKQSRRTAFFVLFVKRLKAPVLGLWARRANNSEVESKTRKRCANGRAGGEWQSGGLSEPRGDRRQILRREFGKNMWFKSNKQPKKTIKKI